jgi:hypothetical protein
MLRYAYISIYCIRERVRNIYIYTICFTTLLAEASGSKVAHLLTEYLRICLLVNWQIQKNTGLAG